MVPRKPDERITQAKELYLQGKKLVEIASQLNLAEGTVRSWKNRYSWNATLQTDKRNVAKGRGGQPKNKNAEGHGAPKQNKNAEKYGFFSKYLPDETREIFNAIEDADPLDLLWHQIQIAYTAIIRAQQIMYVKDKDDKTKSKVEKKRGNVSGEKWEIQYAWDKQASFLQAQARAQSELRSLIKQYDEMLHKNWELTTEEQRTRIDAMKVKAQLTEPEEMEDDGFLEALNGTAQEDWADEES